MSNHTILWTNNGPAVTITNELGNFNSVQATFQNHMVDIGN